MSDKKIRTVLIWTDGENKLINRAYADWLRSGKNGTKNSYMKEIILKETRK